MRFSSPSGRRRQELLFGEDNRESDDELEMEMLVPLTEEGEPVAAQDLDQETLKAIEEDKAKSANERTWQYESAYVHAMKKLIEQVSLKELHLFTVDEKMTLSTFNDAPYSERYILSRLLLRKPGWHPVSSFDLWKEELGDAEFESAVTSLCLPFDENQDEVQVHTPPQEAHLEIQQPPTGASAADAIDLTAPDPLQPIQPKAFIPTPVPPVDPANLKLTHFLEDSQNITLEDAINCLSRDALTSLCKTFRIRLEKFTVANMVQGLLLNADSQAVLASSPKKSRKSLKTKQKDTLKQTMLTFAKISKNSGQQVSRSTTRDRLRELVLKELGPCVRMNPNFTALIHRLHIVGFRATEHPTRLLLPSLLTHFRKRSYPAYIPVRHGSIWPRREDLLEFEEALLLRHRLDEIMNPPKSKEVPTPLAKTPGPKQETDSATPKAAPKELSASQKIAQMAKEFIEAENVFQKWNRFLERPEYGPGDQQEGRGPGLVRFEAGYIYTRILGTLVHCLGLLKEYDYQVKILEALLGQERWRRGKRGEWHERLAIIKQTHLCKVQKNGLKQEVDMKLIAEARECVIAAIQDESIHIVCLPKLFRRLRLLEKKLKLPDDECMDLPDEDEWAKPKEERIEGVRIYNAAEENKNRKDAATFNPDPSAADVIMVTRPEQPIVPKLVDGNIEKLLQSPSRKGKQKEKEDNEQVLVDDQPKGEKAKVKWTGKSLWRGQNGDPVTVEALALEHYARLGFKGMHSETSILTTIFALLFWDILFDANVPGAFETAFQIAPLDLVEDCFYLARKTQIEVRLDEIKDVEVAKNLALKNDRFNRDRKTWCVGVRWDIASEGDVQEIIECIGGDALSLICRLFCEDYSGRCSGVPDLLIWNYEKKECRLVEVKGPGDKASERQKLWFDALISASTLVELCHVKDMNEKAKPLKREKTGNVKIPKKTKKAKISKEPILVESEDEEMADEDYPPADVSANPTRSSAQKRRSIEKPPSQDVKERGGMGEDKMDVDLSIDKELSVLTAASHSLKRSQPSTPLSPRVNRAYVEILSPSKRRKVM